MFSYITKSIIPIIVLIIITYGMIKGRKVYDPLTNTWSTGYWLPIYDNRGIIIQYVPVWKD